MKEKNKKPSLRHDIFCENCQAAEATTLLYFEKYHQETGRTSLINPALICDSCKELYLNINETFENMPRLLAFKVIATWDGRLMGLASRKRYEFTCFANPYFRKKLHRIRYASQPKKGNDAKTSPE